MRWRKGSGGNSLFNIFSVLMPAFNEVNNHSGSDHFSPEPETLSPFELHFPSMNMTGLVHLLSRFSCLDLKRNQRSRLVRHNLPSDRHSAMHLILDQNRAQLRKLDDWIIIQCRTKGLMVV